MSIVFGGQESPSTHDWWKQIERVVTPERLAVGLQLVEQAARELFDNATRREWVITILEQRLHVSPSVAALTVEIAVQLLKIQTASAGVLGAPAGR